MVSEVVNKQLEVVLAKSTEPANEWNMPPKTKTWALYTMLYQHETCTIPPAYTVAPLVAFPEVELSGVSTKLPFGAARHKLDKNESEYAEPWITPIRAGKTR